MFLVCVLGITIITLAGCSASYPTVPTDKAPIAALRIHYRGALSEVPAGTAFSYIAYAVDSDGVYEDVSTRATWVSADPAIVRVESPTGLLRAIEPGTTQIIAEYQGFSTAEFAAVRPRQLSVPFLEVIGSTAGPRGVGLSSAFVWDVGPARDVRHLTTWTSSDPTVATVEPGGLLTAVAPGTVQLKATYIGLSGWCRFSVPPRR